MTYDDDDDNNDDDDDGDGGHGCNNVDDEKYQNSIQANCTERSQGGLLP